MAEASPRLGCVPAPPERAFAKTLPALRTVAESGEENLRTPKRRDQVVRTISRTTCRTQILQSVPAMARTFPVGTTAYDRSATGRTSHELGRHELRDLRGVERGTLAQIVSAHEELERGGVVERPPDPPHPGGIGADDIGGRGELPGRRIVEEDDPGGGREDLARLADGDLALEAGVDGEGVHGDHRDPHTGHGDRQRGQAQDLAGLVPDLHLLRGPAVLAQRTGPRD